MPYIDHLGKTWTRSDDGLRITCEDGRSVMGNPEMTDEHLVKFAYMEPPGAGKSDAERIAELEAQLAAIIASLNKSSS